jgi:phosphoserine/homoserine phosphotransferase
MSAMAARVYVEPQLPSWYTCPNILVRHLEQLMHLVCLDLEGVLVPEIWINFAEATGIEELRLTTRDISDYDVLMKGRLKILAEHRLKLPDIQKVIAGMEPLPGAADFLAELNERGQFVILSDTFTQFAKPLMKKLGWPTLFCNTLVLDEEQSVVDYTLRIQDGKRRSVEAFGSIGYDVIAAGDSYNDISMLKASACGVLFRPPETIKTEFPQFTATYDHRQLLAAIDAAMENCGE